MKKNIVFIPNIGVGNNRNKPYHFSVKSWEKWAEQYDDVEVIEWTEPILSTEDFHIIYQREWVFDILDHNGVNYDQILVVDADTIVHPNCPNFFKETNYEYAGVIENADYEWVTRSINGWGHYLLPDHIKPKTWEYVNTGFIIINEKHKDFFNKVKNYYYDNINHINDIKSNALYQNFKLTSIGQTIVNYFLIEDNIKKTLLPECYNLTNLYMKNLLHVPGRSWWPDELIFLEAGWVYHFNGIPAGTRNQHYWMERTYNELYG